MNKKVILALAILVLVVLACTFTPVMTPSVPPTSGGGGNVQPIIPSSTSIPNATATPTVSAPPDFSGALDYEADPLYGLAKLQRGFSPDPYIVGVGAGGTSDTSNNDITCGFTTDAPTVAFNLSGGASEGFLRIYFVPSDDGAEATLIVHTPNQEWICEDGSSNGSQTDPVIDIEYAASGKYAIWVGMPQSDTYAPGMLYITESTGNTP